MDQTPAEDRSPLGIRTLVLLAAVAFLLRLAFVLLEPGVRIIGDEGSWIGWALEPPGGLATDKVQFSPFRTRFIFYPPLYPYFVALGATLFGSLEGVKLLQCLVGALLAPAVASIGVRTFGRRAGLLAGGAVVVYPELIWFAAHFWSEPVFMVLLWWGFERLLRTDDGGSLPSAMGAGVLWGLSCLARETSLYFLPVAALWLGWRRRWAPAAVFLLTALLTVAPWTYRNWWHYHAFVPVSTAGGLNLWQGNARMTRQEVYDEYKAVHGHLEQYEYSRRKGLEAIRDRQPWWIFEKLRDEMPRFWEADSLVLIHLKKNAYGVAPPWVLWMVAVLVLTPFLVALGLFVRGLAVFEPSRPRIVLLLFLLYYNVIHLATHGFARYRLPILPAILLIAAWGAVHRGPLSPRRRLAAIALSAILAACVIPSLRIHLRHPAFGLVPPDAALPGDADP